MGTMTRAECVSVHFHEGEKLCVDNLHLDILYTPGHTDCSALQLFALATEPARTRGRFDFSTSDLAVRIRDAGMALSLGQGYWHTPPADAVFLHRKLGGLYLLAARLRAKVDVSAGAGFPTGTLTDCRGREVSS